MWLRAGGEAQVEQEDIYTCPICTDLSEARTVTSCGHFFCSDCLTRALAVTPNCPLCRRPLTRADLNDAFTPEEAEAAAVRPSLVVGEFSTKARVFQMREIPHFRLEACIRLCSLSSDMRYAKIWLSIRLIA